MKKPLLNEWDRRIIRTNTVTGDILKLKLAITHLQRDIYRDISPFISRFIDLIIKIKNKIWKK